MKPERVCAVRTLLPAVCLGRLARYLRASRLHSILQSLPTTIVAVTFVWICLSCVPDSAVGARVWFGDQHNDYLARKYLNADLAMIAEVISFMPSTISEHDSLAPDGWTYHRKTIVVLCNGVVDSVLKGEYDDSIISFQSMPYPQRSRSRLVRPSDSLYMMESTENLWDPIPGRIFRPGCYILLLKMGDGAYECIYDSPPNESILDLFKEVEEEGGAYFEKDVDQSERFRYQPRFLQPESVLKRLSRAYGNRDLILLSEVLAPDFRFYRADVQRGGQWQAPTEEYWDKIQCIGFHKNIFNPEFEGENGFRGADYINATFDLIYKEPCVEPDSSRWELTCRMAWTLYNCRLDPKPWGVRYGGVAHLVVKPHPEQPGNWLIETWREDPGQVIYLYKP